MKHDEITINKYGIVIVGEESIIITGFDVDAKNAPYYRSAKMAIMRYAIERLEDAIEAEYNHLVENA